MSQDDGKQDPDREQKAPARPPHPWTKRLRRARGRKSLEWVARRAGVSPSTVQNLENGQGDLSSLKKVAVALGVPVFRVLWRRQPRSRD